MSLSSSESQHSSPSPSEDEEEVGQSFTVESPFPKVIHWFDCERFVPDIEFIIPGAEKPLLVHAVVLVQASTMFTALLKAKASSHDRFNPETRRIEWMFDKTATDEKYRTCLVKWLRFCYGEDQLFVWDECKAALAVLFQLQLECEEKVKKSMETDIIDISEENTECGCQMLVDCVSLNEEFRRKDLKQFCESFARTILCYDNIVEFSDAVVDKCLMVLPFEYLDVAEYDESHTELSEFNIRIKYIKEHESSLSVEDKRTILNRIKAKDLGSEELKQIRESRILEPDELIDLCLKSFQYNEEKSLSARMIMDRLESAKNYRDVDLVASACKMKFIERTRSSTSQIKTGHNHASCCGAIYDSIRNIIVSVSSPSVGCRDLFVTDLDDGTTELKKGIIPFYSDSHCPVYDGKQFLYFMEYSLKQGKGKRFGRINLDTFLFEELPQLPDSKFAVTFGGCFHDGIIYAVDNDAELCCFNVTTRKWGYCGVDVPTEMDVVSVRLLNDAQNKSDYIHALGPGGLYRIDVENNTIDLVSAVPITYDYLREALLIQTEPDEFIVVTALKNGAWYCFSSKDGSWTALSNWKPCKGSFSHNYLVYSPHALSFYYHIHESDKWEAVLI